MLNPLRLALEESHKDLMQWFLMHQECLLLGDDSQAQTAFLAFSDFLQTHLQFENSYVLKTAEDLRWPLKVYQKEHDKLLLMLNKIARLLNAYYPLQGRKKRLALLEVLGYQGSFLHVMEHHEEREEQDLFLQLDDDPAAFKAWQDCEMQLQRYDEDKVRLKRYLAAH
ncbi:MAG: hypothetical protein HRU20_28810 [Pseudomonadales bacterium]|nr:hypothetical protein [Pseudomonadales bacterium]